MLVAALARKIFGGERDADGDGDQIFPLRPQLSGGIEGFNPAVLLAAARVR